MGKLRDDRYQDTEKAPKPLGTFATVVGLLAGLGIIGAVIFAVLGRSLFAPSEQERVLKGLDQLRLGMTPQEVTRILGTPKGRPTAKDMVELLTRSNIDHERITFTESPHFQTGAQRWETPANRT